MTEPTKLKIKIHELSLEKRLGLLHIHNHDTFDFKPKTFIDKDGTARGAYWDKYVLGEDSLAYKEEK